MTRNVIKPAPTPYPGGAQTYLQHLMNQRSALRTVWNAGGHRMSGDSRARESFARQWDMINQRIKWAGGTAIPFDELVRRI